MSDTITFQAANDDALSYDTPPRGVLLSEIPARPKRTRFEMQAEAELGHAFVCLWGLARPRPRRFGDNLGIWPARISVHKDWRDAGRREDPSQPYDALSQWDVQCLPSRAHGNKFKALLDEMCLGQAEKQDSEHLRYAWFDVAEFGALDYWWPQMLSHARVMLELEHTSFDVFDIDTHNHMVRRKAEEIKLRETGRR